MIDAGHTTTIFVGDDAAKRVRWYLFDDTQQMVCAYDADVPDNRQIEVRLPNSYSHQIERGKWQILTQTLETHDHSDVS